MDNLNGKPKIIILCVYKRMNSTLGITYYYQEDKVRVYVWRTCTSEILFFSSMLHSYNSNSEKFCGIGNNKKNVTYSD